MRDLPGAIAPIEQEGGDRVWHRTGDAGYFDPDGRLWLMGRCAARVDDGCGVVYPFAVECAASDVPGLRRTAFVQHGGRRILVIEVEPGVTGVREALTSRLSWASLDDVMIVDQVPRGVDTPPDLETARQILSSI